jgi:hypothetical protein
MVKQCAFECAAADCSNQLNHKDKIAPIVVYLHMVMSIRLKLINAIGAQTRLGDSGPVCTPAIDKCGIIRCETSTRNTHLVSKSQTDCGLGDSHTFFFFFF